MGYVVRTPSQLFYHASLISDVFINIYEYANEIICIPYYWVKVSCLKSYLGTISVVQNS